MYGNMFQGAHDHPCLVITRGFIRVNIRLYSQLRFITAKSTGKIYALDRIQRDQIQAFQSFHIKCHTGYAFSLAEDMCRKPPLEESAHVLGFKAFMEG